MTALVLPSRDRYDEWREQPTESGEEHPAGSGFWGEHQTVLTPEAFGT